MLRSSHWNRERAVRNISPFLILPLIPVNYTKALYVISAQEQNLKLKVCAERTSYGLEGATKISILLSWTNNKCYA